MLLRKLIIFDWIKDLLTDDKSSQTLFSEIQKLSLYLDLLTRPRDIATAQADPWQDDRVSSLTH